MPGSSNLNSFRDRGQGAVQLVSCGVLPPGLVYIYIYIYVYHVIIYVTKTIQVRRTRYARHCWRRRKLFKLDEPDMQDTAGEAEMNSLEMYSYGPPHMAVQK